MRDEDRVNLSGGWRDRRGRGIPPIDREHSCRADSGIGNDQPILLGRFIHIDEITDFESRHREGLLSSSAIGDRGRRELMNETGGLQSNRR